MRTVIGDSLSTDNLDICSLGSCFIAGLENERHDLACHDLGKNDDMPAETLGLINVGADISDEVPLQEDTLFPETSNPRFTKTPKACVLTSQEGSLDKMKKASINSRTSVSLSCSSAWYTHSYVT